MNPINQENTSNHENAISASTVTAEYSQDQQTTSPTVPSKRQNDRPQRSGGSRMRNSRPPRAMVGPKFDTTVTGKRETDHIPPLKDGDIRVIHFGGVEEIGRNMSMVEYKDSIIIVDCGVHQAPPASPETHR